MNNEQRGEGSLVRNREKLAKKDILTRKGGTERGILSRKKDLGKEKIGSGFGQERGTIGKEE